jgi:anti-sigma regulatory factor (Ser/Thr protein kinase)
MTPMNPETNGTDTDSGEHASARYTRTYRRIYEASEEAIEDGPRDLAAYALRCGISPATRSRIATACAEAIDNVVRHAYGVEGGEVLISAGIDGRDLCVTVHDEGMGFDPVLAGLDELHDSRDGGLARCAALSEDLQVESSIGGGTDVLLRFSAYRVHFDEERHVDLSELDFLCPRTSRRVLETLELAGNEDLFHLSPALAVTVGRLLAGPGERRTVRSALRS